MQEHNRSAQDASPDVGIGMYKASASGQSSQDRSQSSGSRSVYKATVSGPTTMIINLGEPRQPPIITNNVHQHQSQQQLSSMSNMRTIITNSVLSNNNNIMNINNNNTNANDLLSLLAPISTVMSTNGVILATANNAPIDAHPYHSQQVNQQAEQQQQHQQHHVSHHQMITNNMVIQHQQQPQLNHQHVLHHLNESGAIIATTSMNNNNVHTNNTSSSSNSSNGGNSLLNNPNIAAVHHLSADIELFEIPITSDNSNSNSNVIQNTANLQSDDVGGGGLHCTVINTQSRSTTVDGGGGGSGCAIPPPAIGDTVDLSTAANTQIVYVNSAGEVALDQPNAHLHSDSNSQHSALEDSLSAGLSMTSEQAESLMNEAVELHKQEDRAQLSLLSIGGGDADADAAASSGHVAGDNSAEQSRFSSPGSMEINLDATLDEEDIEEGVYVDGSSSNQSQTQTVIAGGQQLSLLPGGSGGPNSSIVGGGGYLSHLPSMSIVSGGESTANTTMIVGGNASSTPNSAGGGADQTENKYCIEELCPVCGDKVSGYHYGLLTCESCKGFFKRTVQNKKVYTCVAERQCLIDKTQRKRCPFCRFQKCLDVGMKLEAVRADRMRGGRNKFGPMYKRDRARKLQIMRQRQLAIQTLRGPDGSSPLNSGNYSQSYLNIKQEIQIPQISSLTSSSPDSSPSPIAIALGQVSASGVPTPMSVGTSSSSGSSNSIGNGSGGGGQAGGHSSSSCVGGNGSGNAIGSGVGGGGGGGGGGGLGGGGIGAVSGGPGGTGSANHLGGSQSGGLSVNGSSTNSIPSTTTSSTVHNTATDSKQWFHANSTTASPHSLSPRQFGFDSSSNPTSTADSGPVSEPQSKKPNWKNSKSLNFPRVSPMIRDFVQSVDDREWSQQLFSLLQSQSYNQCEVDVFELMCKVLDQNLFSQVDWARNTIFFKDLKVDDQMKLLQNSWSDMLILDHLHQRIHNNLPDETTLHNGQKFDLLGLGLLGVPQLSDNFNQLQTKLVDLKFDVGDYICLKFLLLLNPVSADLRGITNLKHVQEGFDNVQAALLDYTLTCYATVTEKFTKLVGTIPLIHSMAAQGEEHLYLKHCAGGAPTQTLLMEMLHAKRK